MFDLGWQEFILIALVAVMVVGPKDLPRVIRTVGQWIRKARSLASEFQGSLEEMARESELDDVRKSIQEASRGGVGATIEKHVDPDGDIRRSFEDARDSSGADEIEAAVDEARRDTRALASSGAAVDSDMVHATEAPVPGSSVTPLAAVPAVKPDGAAKTAKAPAKRASKAASPKAASPKVAAPRTATPKAAVSKAATPKAAATKTSAPKVATVDSSAKPPAAKPKRPSTRKPAAGKAGEA